MQRDRFWSHWVDFDFDLNNTKERREVVFNVWVGVNLGKFGKNKNEWWRKILGVVTWRVWTNGRGESDLERNLIGWNLLALTTDL